MSSYALPADLAQLSLKNGALSSISTPDQQAAIDRASEEADSYLRARYALPLVAWGLDLRGKVCDLAAWYALKARGYNPEPGANDNIRAAAKDAIAWLSGVSKRYIHPDVTPSVTVTISQLPNATGNTLRGW